MKKNDLVKNLLIIRIKLLKLVKTPLNVDSQKQSHSGVL